MVCFAISGTVESVIDAVHRYSCRVPVPGRPKVRAVEARRAHVRTVKEPLAIPEGVHPMIRGTEARPPLPRHQFKEAV